MNLAEAFHAAGAYLPATVIAAILLFIVRELLDGRRKRAERVRKTRAIKLLLADELEKNNWAHVSFFRILSTMKETSEKSVTAQFWVHTARNGSEHFRMKEHPEDQYDSGGAIPPFSVSMYEKVLPSLAELDEELFEKIRDTYEEIIELSHYRQTLVDYLAGETLAPDPDMTKHFLLDFADRRDRYFNVLSYGYRALTGKDLDSWKLR